MALLAWHGVVVQLAAWAGGVRKLQWHVGTTVNWVWAMLNFQLGSKLLVRTYKRIAIGNGTTAVQGNGTVKGWLTNKVQ